MEESPNYLASSNIRVDEAAQPLTHPFEPAGNHGWDNEQNDLILYSRDILCNDVTQHTYRTFLRSASNGNLPQVYSGRKIGPRYIWTSRKMLVILSSTFRRCQDYQKPNRLFSTSFGRSQDPSNIESKLQP